MDGPTIHASAVLVGVAAILIRGPSGAGKSRLALRLIQMPAGAPRDNGALFTRLVADDRVHVAAAHGRLVARPAPQLAGLLEVRGIGIIRLPHEPAAVVSLVIDLDAAVAERMPEENGMRTSIEGVWLPRLAVAPADPFPTVLAALTSGRVPGPEKAASGAADAAAQHRPEYRLRSALGWS